MGHGNKTPKIKLDRAFMPVLVTNNFDDDSIKNEQASLETPFSHYKSMGNVLDLKGSLLRSQWSNLAEIWARPRHHFLYYNFISQWEISVAMDTRVLIQFASKHYAAFPHPK